MISFIFVFLKIKIMTILIFYIKNNYYKLKCNIKLLIENWNTLRVANLFEN